MRYHQSKENKEAIAIANRLLDEPNADPDDEIRILSRQLLRMADAIERLLNDLKEYDNAALEEGK